MLTDFKPGDQVFEIQANEEDLLTPKRIGTFVGETIRRMGFEDCEVTWRDGNTERCFSQYLSLIPTKDNTNVLLYPGPSSLVPSGSVSAIYVGGFLTVDGRAQPYRGDLILSRNMAGTVPSKRRRSCDFFDTDGKLIREGDVIRSKNEPSGKFWDWVVLWNYDEHGWQAFEITKDGFRTGRVHRIKTLFPFKRINSVWTIPPMEYGITDQHNVVPSHKLYKARTK